MGESARMSEYPSSPGVLRQCGLGYARHGTARARDIVQQYLQWPIIIVEPPDLICAMEQAKRYRWSFWDALIVTTAQKAQASVLWTEDLNPGQRVGDVVIRNPFLPDRVK